MEDPNYKPVNNRVTPPPQADRPIQEVGTSSNRRLSSEIPTTSSRVQSQILANTTEQPSQFTRGWSSQDNDTRSNNRSLFSFSVSAELPENRETTLDKAQEQGWIRPSEDFTPVAEIPRPGGSSLEMQFYQECSSGALWLGKCSPHAMYNPLLLKRELEKKHKLSEFLGAYMEEILEKLGLAIYEKLGIEVPQSVLSYQFVSEKNQATFECDSPRLHFLSKIINGFQHLKEQFLEEYLLEAKSCGHNYTTVKDPGGEELELRGLGSILAAADFLYDLDCLGNRCGNIGYVIREDKAGQRYAQVVKIDAGYAFSYYKHRYDQAHDPLNRNIRIAPNKNCLHFADLAWADQQEFAHTAKRILQTPKKEFEYFFNRAGRLEESIPPVHLQALLDGLIARKRVFLAAFASETDQTIKREIESSQARLATWLNFQEASTVTEQLLELNKEEAHLLSKLRVRLVKRHATYTKQAREVSCQSFGLFASNPRFVGREQALADIAQQLDSQSGIVIAQSISGIGGVGKTQLALQYANLAAQGKQIGGKLLAYDYIVWLNAEALLETQFQALAEVWLGNQLKVAEAVPAVYQFLNGKRCLIVFDNAENAHSIYEFLPPRKHKSHLHLLITSRSSQWGGIHTLKLGGFNVEEAQQYVEGQLGPQSKEAVAKLMGLLGGLPLALSQAVAYIKSGHCSLEDYEKQFYLNQADLLSNELLEEEEHPKTIGTTLVLSLAHVKIRHPLVEEILGIAAYLSPDEISLDLIRKAILHASREKNQEQVKRIVDPATSREAIEASFSSQFELAKVIEIQEALRILEDYSLISYDKGRQNIAVHRLVQEVVRRRHKILEQLQKYWNVTLEMLKAEVVDDERNIEKTKSCSHAIAHVKQIARISKSCQLTKKNELSLAGLLSKSGSNQYTIGNYRVAKEWHKQTLKICEKHHEADHLKLANILGNLGIAYSSLGNFDKHKQLIERALRIQERHFGVDHPETAKTLCNLSNAYGDLGSGNTLKQKELLERALKIQERHLGADHPSVAHTLGCLGIAYGDLGDSDMKKKLLERALKIKKDYFGTDHPEVAIALCNLGNAYGASGDIHKKKKLLERALKIQERHFEADHIILAGTLVNLGNVYGDLGLALEQKELLERALKIQEKHFGVDHPETAVTLSNLGIAYGDFGNFSKRKGFLERALGIQEKRYGTDHPEVARILANLGPVYGALGDILKEKNVLERALKIQQERFGADHPVVAKTLGNLGLTYGKLGDFRRQKQLLKRTLKIQETHYGADHFEVAVTLGNLGLAYGKLGDPFKKKQLLERALPIDEKHYGADHPEVAFSLTGLATACLALKQISKANEYAQRAYKIVSQRFDKEYEDVKRLAAALVRECQHQFRINNTATSTSETSSTTGSVFVVSRSSHNSQSKKEQYNESKEITTTAKDKAMAIRGIGPF